MGRGRGRPLTAAELAARSVTLQLPAWMGGGDPRAMAATCRWQLDPEEPASGHWRVRLAERVLPGAQPGGALLRLTRLSDAGDVGKPSSYQPLRRLPPSDQHAGDARGLVRVELQRLAREGAGNLGAGLASQILATLGASDSDLPAVVQRVLRDGLLPGLPHAAAWLVEVDVALSYRFKFTAVLQHIADDPDLLNRPESEFPGFASGQGLLTDATLGLGAYLAPLLLSLSPWVWGMSAPRYGGVIVYTFGGAIPGRDGEAAEPLQLFTPQSGRTSGRRLANPQPGHLAKALRWWVTQLDALFTEASDPTNHRATDGSYASRRAFETLLSLEQAFRNVQSLSVHDRDPHAQRVLLFDTLDTLEGLRLLSFEDMCRLPKARATLDELERQLPRAAVDVLLPRARAAVTALEDLQDGFFLPSRLVAGGLRLPDKNRGEVVLPLEQAAAAYLRVRRNAGHAFGGKPNAGRARDEVLLMTHDGRFPDALPDLVYLYLLRLLAAPELLRRGP